MWILEKRFDGKWYVHGRYDDVNRLVQAALFLGSTDVEAVRVREDDPQ